MRLLRTRPLALVLARRSLSLAVRTLAVRALALCMRPRAVPGRPLALAVGTRTLSLRTRTLPLRALAVALVLRTRTLALLGSRALLAMTLLARLLRTPALRMPLESRRFHDCGDFRRLELEGVAALH